MNFDCGMASNSNVSSGSDESGEERENGNQLYATNIDIFKQKVMQTDEFLKKLVIKDTNAPNKTSKVWKFYGAMFYNNRKILDKFVFCRSCFDPQPQAQHSTASTSQQKKGDDSLKKVQVIKS